MKGPKPKYPIQFLENEISELRQLVSARKSPQVKVMRARVVLDAHEHPTGATSKSQRMLDVPTVLCGNGDDDGQRARALKTSQGLGCRGVFSPEVRAQAIALACSLPVVCGRSAQTLALS